MLTAGIDALGDDPLCVPFAHKLLLSTPLTRSPTPCTKQNRSRWTYAHHAKPPSYIHQDAPSNPTKSLCKAARAEAPTSPSYPNGWMQGSGSWRTRHRELFPRKPRWRRCHRNRLEAHHFARTMRACGTALAILQHPVRITG